METKTKPMSIEIGGASVEMPTACETCGNAELKIDFLFQKRGVMRGSGTFKCGQRWAVLGGIVVQSDGCETR